jgi:hypothetical protein
MSILRASIFAAILLTLSGLTAAAAPLTVGQLLERAEHGERQSLLMLAAGGKLVFPDGSLSSAIETGPELTELMGQLTVRQSLYILAIYADNGFLATDPDAWRTNTKPDPVIACTWVTRAANYPPDGSVEDKTAVEMLRGMADEMVQRLDDDERAKCLERGRNWSLKP